MTTDAKLLAQRYTLEETVASGAMTTVWRARDGVLARAVAVKILHPHLSTDAEFLERFRREALAAARLTHPAIVAIYDTGEDRDDEGGGRHYIVMEYCAGGTLADLLRREGPLTAERVASIGAVVCDALEYAHNHDVVHRDVKPGNVLLTPDGAVKVADFGIAKAAEAGDITTTGAVLGTVAYLSPEQAQGEEPTARSDLYSLGVVLYELLVGRPPFREETHIATAMKHLQSAPLPPRALKAGIPRSLETTVLKALEKDPDKRFGSAAEMKAALLQTTPSVGAETTAFARPMPRSPAAPAPPAGPSPTRSIAPVVALIAIAIVAAIVISYLAASNGGKKAPGPAHSGAPGSGQQIPVSAVTSFDPPPGDGSEHPERVALTTDGNSSTYWYTSTYASTDFGGLKPGVGLVFDLGSSKDVGHVEITSTLGGYSFDLRAADSPAADYTGFALVKHVDNAGTTETLSFPATSHRYWLLWITSLPPGGRATIAEVHFLGP
jgi:serine/threonine-protein kinase